MRNSARDAIPPLGSVEESLARMTPGTAGRAARAGATGAWV